MIRPPIWMAADEPKCIASSCSWPKPCARRDIAYTPGRKLADFSLHPPYGYPECGAPKWGKWVPLADAVKPAEPKEAKAWIGS